MKAIIVNGSAGTGKSTLLNSLSSQQLEKFALVDGDDLVRIIPFELTQEFLNVVIDNIVSCAENFQKYNYNVLVISFIFPTQKRLITLRDKLCELGIDVYVFNLYCENDLLKKRIIVRNTSKLISVDKAVEMNEMISKLPCDYLIDTTAFNNQDLVKCFMQGINEVCKVIKNENN